MRVLVTGAGGFVGGHLLRHLLQTGHQAIAFGRTPGLRQEDVPFVEGDVRDTGLIQEILTEQAPDAVVHLAAQSSVGLSWTDPSGTLETNTLGSLSLLEAARQASFRGVILSVGSSEEYGPQEGLLTEATCPRPTSIYGIAKLAQGHLAQTYFRRWGLRVIHVRPFNHTGVGQSPSFVLSDWAEQVKRMQKQDAPRTLQVGNIDVVRDFSDVEDVVRAYVLLLEKGEPGEIYNVSRGYGVFLEFLAHSLLRISGISADIASSAHRQRSQEIPVMVGDSSKLRRATGWEPQIDYDNMLSRLLHDQTE